MKIGLVGYQGSGKSTLFEWLTGVKAGPGLGAQRAKRHGHRPEPRVEGLCKIYQPKKVTLAALELVDTPGLSRTHEGNAARLALIREAGCLVLVVAAFGRTDPLADLRSFDEDLMLADMEIVTSRLKRVEDSLRKPLPKQEHEQLLHEQATLKHGAGSLEAGQPLRETRHDRRAAQGHPLLPPAWREAAGGGLQHGRRRAAPRAVRPRWARRRCRSSPCPPAWNWNWRR